MTCAAAVSRSSLHPQGQECHRSSNVFLQSVPQLGQICDVPFGSTNMIVRPAHAALTLTICVKVLHPASRILLLSPALAAAPLERYLPCSSCLGTGAFVLRLIAVLLEHRLQGKQQAIGFVAIQVTHSLRDRAGVLMAHDLNALIAQENQVMRSQVDLTLRSSVGGGYQGLIHKYSSLSQLCVGLGCALISNLRIVYHYETFSVYLSLFYII